MVETFCAMYLEVASGDIAYYGARHVFTFLFVEELFPYSCANAESSSACAILRQDVHVFLWRVWAHLEEQDVASTVKLAVANDDIAGIITFAAKGNAASCFLKIAVLYDDVAAWPIGRVFIHECTLAPFDAYAVVVDIYPTTTYQHVLASIYVDGIGAWSFRIAFGRSVDIAVQIFHSLALIEVIGPETRVYHSDAAYLYVC